jgi:hypothetical protein
VSTAVRLESDSSKEAHRGLVNIGNILNPLDAIKSFEASDYKWRSIPQPSPSWLSTGIVLQLREDRTVGAPHRGGREEKTVDLILLPVAIVERISPPQAPH